MPQIKLQTPNNGPFWIFVAGILSNIPAEVECFYMTLLFIFGIGTEIIRTYITYKTSCCGWQIEHKDSNTSANLPNLPQRSATRACRCNLRKLISFKNHIEGKESFERSM